MKSGELTSGSLPNWEETQNNSKLGVLSSYRTCYPSQAKSARAAFNGIKSDLLTGVVWLCVPTKGQMQPLTGIGGGRWWQAQRAAENVLSALLYTWFLRGNLFLPPCPVSCRIFRCVLQQSGVLKWSVFLLQEAVFTPTSVWKLRTRPCLRAVESSFVSGCFDPLWIFSFICVAFLVINTSKWTLTSPKLNSQLMKFHRFCVKFLFYFLLFSFWLD